MKNKLSIAKKILNTFELIGRNRVRHELLMMSDRNLKDIGFSRELLEKGVSAWPWRVEIIEADVLQAEFKQQPAASDFSQRLSNVA